MTTYTATVQYDNTLDEYVLPLTEEVCNQLGWKEGDILVWIDNKDGTFTVKKKDD